MAEAEFPVKLKFIVDNAGVQQISKAIGGGFMDGMRGGILGGGGGSGMIGGLGGLFGKAGVFGLMVKGLDQLNTTVTNMFKYSPAMTQSLKALETSFFLIMKPIGDFIGAILRPVAIWLLDWIVKNRELATLIGAVILGLAAIKTVLLGKGLVETITGGGGAAVGAATGVGTGAAAGAGLLGLGAAAAGGAATGLGILYLLREAAKGEYTGRRGENIQYQRRPLSFGGTFGPEADIYGSWPDIYRWMQDQGFSGGYTSSGMGRPYMSEIEEMQKFAKEINVELHAHRDTLRETDLNLNKYAKYLEDSNKSAEEIALGLQSSRKHALEYIGGGGKLPIGVGIGMGLELEEIPKTVEAINKMENEVDNTTFTITEYAGSLRNLIDATGKCILSFNDLSEAQSKGLFTVGRSPAKGGYGGEKPQNWRVRTGKTNPYT